MDEITISIICPVYNEEDMVPIFVDEVVAVLTKIGKPYEMLFIDDGSKDRTLEKLLTAKQSNKNIRIVKLSNNFGKEAALTAGLNRCKGDVVIPMDADLQDPPELIFDLIGDWEKGFDVVLARRSDRSSDSFFKRMTAQLFYKFHNRISHVQIPEDVGDCRLITKKVVDALRLLPENQRFMKGLFAWAGFEYSVVAYKRECRKAGTSCFNGWRLWNFALDGITSFSTVPLRIWVYVGLIIALFSFLYGGYIILYTLIKGVKTPGFATLFSAVSFLGGIQLIGIGVLGEYIGRIYMESKRRPPYLIDKEY